jgi:hypothetical protein
MPSDYEEQIALQGTLISRPESPALEGAAAEAIEEAFRELIERRYLYQKLTVDLGRVDAAVKQAVDEATMRASTPGAGAAGGFISQPIPASPKRLAELRSEIEKRPWWLVTRHVGDNPRSAEIHRMARLGGQPLGTQAHEMNLMFYLPAVQLRCPGRCKRNGTFIALVSSSDSGFDSPYPRQGNTGTEQIFVPIYRCEMCRETIYTILIRRGGLRLHLCGFAPRREPSASKPVPEPLVPILSDADQAVAEGDTYAGFYHLRTMLEHYLKTRLGIAISQQFRGDELIAKHYKMLLPAVAGVVPSVAVAWERLSYWLHTRTGEAEDYQTQRDAICRHIDVLNALGETAVVQPPPNASEAFS